MNMDDTVERIRGQITEVKCTADMLSSELNGLEEMLSELGDFDELTEELQQRNDELTEELEALKYYNENERIFALAEQQKATD